MVTSAWRPNLFPTRLSLAGVMQAVQELASRIRLRSSRLPNQWDNLVKNDTRTDRRTPS